VHVYRTEHQRGDFLQLQLAKERETTTQLLEIISDLQQQLVGNFQAETNDYELSFLDVGLPKVTTLFGKKSLQNGNTNTPRAN
jgi:hypothetical protein